MVAATAQPQAKVTPVPFGRDAMEALVVGMGVNEDTVQMQIEKLDQLRTIRMLAQGLQGRFDQDFLSDQRVISTVKHFVGDGGTEGGEDGKHRCRP